MKNTNTRLFESELCVGCGLCESITKGGVKLDMQKNGFLKPIVHKPISGVDYSLIKKTCPAESIHKDKSIRAPQFDPFWGDYYSCYIGSSQSDEIESKASSGGVISTILIYLLENKLVDFAIHIGPNPDRPLENIVKLSKNSNEVLENADSRYAPSSPLKNIYQLIEDGKKYVFVGKPCDVAALRQLSFLDDFIKKHIKYYLSFFCFGIPSINQTHKLINQLGVSDFNNIKKLQYRKIGWPGSFNILMKNDQNYSINYKDYMHFLFSDLNLRCKICPDGLGESADLTCGDAWNEFDENGYPSFENARGSNIIISKTNTGNELLEKLIIDGVLRIENKVQDLRSLDIIQPGQLGKKKYYIYRIFAFILSGRKIPKIDKYIYNEIHKVVKIDLKSKLYQVYGTWMRLNRKIKQ